MNERIAKIGSFVVIVSVIIFAICMLIPFDFGSYFICMLLPIGFLMMTAGFLNECENDKKVSGIVGIILAAVYIVLILLVYFAQTTVVQQGQLNDQAMQIINYKRGGLIFCYDLLGYGMMALSTFFTGMTIIEKTKGDKVLKWLMMIHGIFFIGCFFIPMTGVFSNMSDNGSGIGGVVALEFWCAYFLPIGILSYRHFGKGK